MLKLCEALAPFEMSWLASPPTPFAPALRKAVHKRSRSKRACAYAVGFLQEEPLPCDDLESYAWLIERSPVPIAAGEHE